MSDKRIVLIHGNWGGTGDDNWFPYVKKELSKYGVEVLTPTMPDNVLAKESVWIPYMKDVLKVDENTVVVGHSSGGVAAMRFAERYPLLGSVLVGVCHTDLGDDNEKASGYYSRPWNWSAIKSNQQWMVQYASIDDPYIPIDEARFISEQLDTDYREKTDKGHFGSDKQAMTKFPELVDLLVKKLDLKTQ